MADEGGPSAPADRSGDAGEAPPPRESRRPAKAPGEGGLRERKPSPSSGEVGGASRRPAGAGGGAGVGAGAGTQKDVNEGAGSLEKDRKDLMKMVVQQNKKKSAHNSDNYSIVVGTAHLGKSTLIKWFLNKYE